MVKLVELDRTFAALSDGTRRGMLERLQLGPASITELARGAGISLPGTLKHVRVLEEARLLTTEKTGRTRQCRLGPEGMDAVQAWIERQQRHWERRLDRIEQALEAQKGDTR
jgi:DNA-binding transcriptional ArsR family regulator